MIHITLQQRVKASCELAGMSLTELAEKLGMSQQNFSKRLKVGKFTQEELEENFYTSKMEMSILYLKIINCFIKEKRKILEIK